MKYIISAMLTICFFLFLLSVGECAPLNPYIQFDFSQLEQAAKQPLASPVSGTSIAAESRDVFFITRHKTTKKLSWHLYNPSVKKITLSGECPFVDYNQFSISAKASFAFAYSKFPAALWLLDTKTKKWQQVFKNPGKGEKGLAISPQSYPIFISDDRAQAFMDLWDKEHYVTEVIAMAFSVKPFKMSEIMSLDKFRKEAVDKYIGKKENKKIPFLIDTLRFSDNSRAVAGVIKSRSNYHQPGFRNYFFLSQPELPLKQIDESAGRILPLDMDFSKILYTIDTKNKAVTYLLEDDTKTVVADNEYIPLVGKIFKNGKIGLYAKKGSEFSVFLGSSGKMAKAITFGKPYPVAFAEDMLIVLKEKSMVYYKLP